MADIPGLIEGAAEGVGLGHDFLRHVERTKVLLHVVDAAGTEGRDPVEDIYTIQREINLYNENILKDKPQIIAANKIDVGGHEENLERLKAEFEPQGIKVIPISAAANDNLQELLKDVAELLATAPEQNIIFEPEFEEISQMPDGHLLLKKSSKVTSQLKEQLLNVCLVIQLWIQNKDLHSSKNTYVKKVLFKLLKMLVFLKEIQLIFTILNLTTINNKIYST